MSKKHPYNEDIKRLNDEKKQLIEERTQVHRSNMSSKIMYFFGIPSIFLSFAGFSYATNTLVTLSEIIPIAAIAAAIIIPINLIMNGTFSNRRKKLEKLDKAIVFNRQERIDLANELNISKQKAKQLTSKKTKFTSIKPMNRTDEYTESTTGRCPGAGRHLHGPHIGPHGIHFPRRNPDGRGPGHHP